MQIKTASQQAAVIKAGSYKRYIENAIYMQFPTAGFRPNWRPRGAIHAEIIRSSWVVCCDVRGCRGAVFVEPGEPFFCDHCIMMLNDGYAKDVIWPDNRAEIERTLLLRPIPLNRNWTPGAESLAELIVQNIERGDPAPV